MELSKRLEAVAELVTPGYKVADIGTDHAYVPIRLVLEGKSPSAVAMDVNEGPLLRAEEHIREYGLENVIGTRRSDGLKELKDNEADSMIAAGMGGALIIRILSEGFEKAAGMKECILQPQSEIGRVRRYLIKNGFSIEKENIVCEEGKYYPMMRAVPGKKEQVPYAEEEYEYGRLLLENRHPVLLEFLRRETAVREKILEQLTGKEELAESARLRVGEIQKEIERLHRAMERYE